MGSAGRGCGSGFVSEEIGLFRSRSKIIPSTRYGVVRGLAMALVRWYRGSATCQVKAIAENNANCSDIDCGWTDILLHFRK